jgi:toxin ParE1/3/4
LTAKPVIPRRRAMLDDDEIADYVLESGPEAIALGFVDAPESAYAQIGDHPGIGSLRHSYELELPGLRARMLKGYPYLVFYVERDDHVDVWRILQGSRDIPRLMRDPAGPS